MVGGVVKEPEGTSGPSDSDDDGAQVHPAPRSIPVKVFFFMYFSASVLLTKYTR